MTPARTFALALAVAACGAPASASAAGDPVTCFRQFVTVAEPVPQTPEEYVAKVVRDVNRVVTFAGCTV